ncbi:hypothetical protein HK105_202853 [Polyrhizophydium stewartii]|uniref:NADH dehydrogenase [ubiquinone] 1 alpha subcomplex subunit 13 n=1 Tax=Polyrhizophydium stewartii TaxID=2732419 RepID=A0ABR4NDG3_9FUNG|nr:hypothetical protein HK105_003783 [Polyrhizophydium stewartii]
MLLAHLPVITSMSQDLPPAGGFPETVHYKRYLPARGPSGAVMILGVLGIMVYGWNSLAKANAENRELRREAAWARIHLAPMLQAEADRDIVRRMQQVKAREAEIMKDVPDWSAGDLKAPVKGLGKYGVADPSQAESVYNTQRFVQPSFVFLPKEAEGESYSVLSPQWWRGSTMLTKNPPYHHREDFTKEHPLGK